MSWFDEQIKQRLQSDNDAFEDSFVQMAGAVMGRNLAGKLNDERQKTKDALDEILKYYNVKVQELPEGISDLNEQLEYLLRPSGIMRRKVLLTDGWYRQAVGAFLATAKDGGATALIPDGMSGYSYLDRQTGRRVRVSRKNAGDFEREAISFYRPLPARTLTLRDLTAFMVHTLSGRDYLSLCASAFVVVLVGMLTPEISNLILVYVAGSGDMRLLAACGVMLVCAVASGAVLTGIRKLIVGRMRSKAGVSLQAAVMMRVLSLPAGFFRQHSAGELAQRVESLDALSQILAESVLSLGFTALFSLIYIVQIFGYAPGLAVPAILVIAALALMTVIETVIQTGVVTRQMDARARESGINYAMISGIQKIRLSGAEKRAFVKWASAYGKNAAYAYNPPLIIRLNRAITVGITLLGTVALFWSAMRTQISVADYYSFNAAYGMVTGAFAMLSGSVMMMAQIRPALGMVRPILEAVPEVSGGKKIVTKLNGAIELNNVSFRYSRDMPPILDNLSLKIRPGQYVAVVGRTGCGKSTLMRVMLGFETPEKGSVYYDRYDLAKTDPKSLRRRIGTVMQDGRLFLGDIYSNIVISAPWMTLDEAWEAAEMAGIADDIREMPMGMHTLISEGQGGVSGGQRQRLMIARAIAPRPKVLIFDEATSALDNLTQKKVSDSLDRLKCTRIVIAHRLSTIRNCERILVLDKGRIAEDGTYEELIKQNGIFAELVERQRIDHA